MKRKIETLSGGKYALWLKCKDLENKDLVGVRNILIEERIKIGRFPSVLVVDSELYAIFLRQLGVLTEEISLEGIEVVLDSELDKMVEERRLLEKQ